MKQPKAAAFVSILWLLGPVAAYPSHTPEIFSRADSTDPGDWSWIKNFAVLGDSYAAGIGAGFVLKGNGDSDCSRYDRAYGMIMNQMFGAKADFKFKACSGDKSSQVLDQV